MLLVTVSFCLLLSTNSVLGRPQESATAPPPTAAQAQSSGPSSTPIPIISQTEVVGADGSFNFSYETGNGIKIQEGGYLKKVPSVGARSGELKAEGEGSEEEIQVLQGSYSYTAPDGQVISLRYIADENGFQPEGDHLPTTPPVPQDIQRSLGKISAEPEASEPVASQSQPQPVKQKPDEPAPKPETPPEATSAPEAATGAPDAATAAPEAAAATTEAAESSTVA